MNNNDEIINLIYEYIFYEIQRNEDDKIQLINNFCFREIDYLDYLELILANHKIECAQKIFDDIISLITNYHNDF